MELNVQTYLFFPGCCAEAIEVYQRALGAEVLHLTPFSQAPAPLRATDREHLVFHATIRIGDTLLNVSDDPLGESGNFGGFALLVHVASNEAVDAALAILSDGGTVRLPAQKTFWSSRYGIAVDRFGITWKLQYSAD